MFVFRIRRKYLDKCATAVKQGNYSFYIWYTLSDYHFNFSQTMIRFNQWRLLNEQIVKGIKKYS